MAPSLKESELAELASNPSPTIVAQPRARGEMMEVRFGLSLLVRCSETYLIDGLSVQSAFRRSLWVGRKCLLIMADVMSEFVMEDQMGTSDWPWLRYFFLMKEISKKLH